MLELWITGMDEGHLETRNKRGGFTCNSYCVRAPGTAIDGQWTGPGAAVPHQPSAPVMISSPWTYSAKGTLLL